MSELNHEEIKEAVCIDTGRVYDSCMDRDCVENLRVYFNECAQSAIQSAISCKVKCCEVADVKIDVEPVAFKRGYYSCDLTFFFTLNAEITTNPAQCPQEFCGIAAYTKKVILCGSEGNVKVFTSKMRICDDDYVTRGSNLPKCTVQVVDPVVLDAKICDICCNDTLTDVPNAVLSAVNGELTTGGSRGLFVTLGLFSIVQLVRNVQLLVPSYAFCMPHKECNDVNTDSPCDMFRKIKFPTDEFFPKSCDNDCCCHEHSEE